MIDDENNTSDEELQEAFAAGKLKPGINIPTVVKTFTNNVTGLKERLNEFKLNLQWVERLDLNCLPAPMAPEMHHEVTEKEKTSVVKLKTHLRMAPKNSDSNLALDDFKREMTFHRQAQAALIEGVAKLTALGIPTHRPEDYFAEMAKSDQHMHKVRESLAAKKAGVQKSERISELRRQRKLSKQTQVENKLKQAKEKKQMLNEVQKFRKGIRKDLNFLDGGDKSKTHSKRAELKKKYKDQKFGFGGKKRGSKRNTKESSSNFGNQKAAGKHARGKAGKGGSRGKAGKGGNKRPGKSNRMKAKGRK